MTVSGAMSKHSIIGPYFFEEEGATVTVTSARYTDIVKFFLPQLPWETMYVSTKIELPPILLVIQLIF